MKNILLAIINNDTSYNKSATKMLKRSDPEMWRQIIEKTSFLPDTAKPRQRVWHIINDIYEIPKCPITHNYVKWHENRYLETLNPTAAITLQHQRGVFANCYTPEINEKRAASNRGKTIASGTRKIPNISNETLKARVEKIKQTCLERYGVKNPSQTKEAKEKIYQKAVERGCTPRKDRSIRRIYYDAVWKFTEESWKSQFDKINPARLNRTHNALDHIYSIQQGFRDCIPPFIIGHYSNLRVISLSENGIKGMRCDKTKEELFEDFFT